MRSPLADPQFQHLYEVLGPLGKGGMGEVVRIRHRVWELDLAAKVPLPDAIASAGGLARLRREAETWIRLPSHPNVVTCHYVRSFADTPVIFIEFVEGGSLTDAIGRGLFKSGASSDALITQALSIAFDVAHGLAHAHAAGVVHQDVKPSNVLLDTLGAKITDFGIAAAGRIEASAIPEFRGDGTMVATVVGMTPLYASPEQLLSLRSSKPEKSEPITRATDIWSLGLTLLEMLLGQAPWGPGNIAHVFKLSDARWEDVLPLLRRMLDQAPEARPKAAEVAEHLATLLARRGVHREPPENAEMRADGLNNRAVSLLDLDLHAEARSLLHQALAADPCHPEAVFNDALLAWRAGETTDRGALEQVRQALSAKTGWEPELLEAWIQIERGDEKNAWSVLDRVAEHAAGAVRGTRAVARASRAVRDSVREIASFQACPQTADALAIFPGERRVAVGGRDGCIRIFDLASGQCERRIQAHSDFAFDVAVSRDGRLVYSVGWDTVFAIHDIQSGAKRFEEKQPGKLSSLVLSPDEKRAWIGSYNGTFRAFALEKGRATSTGDLLSLPNDLSIMCAALTPDGQTLLVCGEDDILRYIDVMSGQVRKSLTLSSRPYDIAFGTEAGRGIFALGRGDQQISLHDLESGEQLGALRNLQSWVSVVAIHPNGRWAVSSNGLHWSLWDLPARRCARTFEAPALITGAVFLSNGELITLDWSGMVRRYIFDEPSRAPTMVALPHRARELAAGRAAVHTALAESEAALSAGHIGEALVAAKRARQAKGFERAPDVLALWGRLAERAERTGVRTVWPMDRFGPVKASSGLALDPERRCLATANEQGTLHLWALDMAHPPKPIREIHFPEGELFSRTFAFSGNNKTLAVGTYRHIHLIDLEGGPARSIDTLPGYVRKVAFGGPRGAFLAALDDHGHAHVFRARDLEWIATVRGPEDWVNALAFENEERILVGDYDGHLFSWDIQRAAEGHLGPRTWSSDNQRKPIPAQAFIRDLGVEGPAGTRSVTSVKVRDGRIYYGCADKALHILGAESGKPITKLMGHGSTVSCFDFMGEHHLVTGSYDKSVRIFDMRSGACLSVVEGHTHTIWDIAALDTQNFLTASDDGQVRRFYIDWELSAPAKA